MYNLISKIFNRRHRDSGQGIEDPFGNIIAKNFAIFYSEVAKPEKLAREFKEITVAAVVLSYAASELGCHKNRYADIYPCEYPSNYQQIFFKILPKFPQFPRRQEPRYPGHRC